MSAAALAWAWRQPVPDHGSLVVLLKLADQANDDGVCWPSRRTISEDCKMSVATVKRRLRLLQQDGFLTSELRTRDNGSRTSSLYRLRMTPAQDDPGVTQTPPPGQPDPTPRSRRLTQPELPVEPTSTSEEVLGARALDERTADPPRAPAVRSPRARDPIWDELVTLFGAEAAGLERGRWNAACKSLRASGATPETLRHAATVYRTHPSFAECVMTPTALAANWTILAGNGKTADDLRREEFRARIAEFDARTNGGDL